MGAADDLVERLLPDGEFAVLGLLEGVTEAVAGVLVARVGQGGDVREGCELVERGVQPVGAGAGGVVFAAGVDGWDLDRSAVGGGDGLDVAAVVLVFSGPSQVGAVGDGCGDAVGADDGAVEGEVGVSGGNGTFQRGGQVRGVIGEHSQPLVEVAVGGGQ